MKKIMKQIFTKKRNHSLLNSIVDIISTFKDSIDSIY